MFKNLLTLVIVAFTCSLSFGQVTVLDFETPETSSIFQYFGIADENVPNNIIANPAPDAVNGSAMVGDFVKPAASEPWAGAFGLETLTVDVSAMAEVCIKVHMPVISSLSLKIENSTTGGDNWILTVPNTMVNVWEEICFDVTQNSIEDPMVPAFGNSYATAVIFFEFQTVLTEERTYYFDDLVVKQGNAASEGDVTFSVDMNDYADPFTTVAVFGTFNSFDPAANPLTDNGDGTWSTTITDIPVGPQEYLFIVDGMAAESLSSTSTCTITTGDFTNRQLIVTGDASLPTVCFNSCYACGEGATFTVNLGTSNIIVSPEGMFIAGGGNFGNPGDVPLIDLDGDGVYSATFERAADFTSYFTFTNGACPDYSCKENIEGQSCANPDNFNDRFVDLTAGDVELNTCFGICSDTNDDCGMAQNPGNITFQLDMNNFSGAFTTTYIFGAFNNFDATANPMTDDNDDGIWETTVALVAGPNEYKFLADGTEEVLTVGDPCTITTPDGIFTNRLIEVSGDETVCFVWETCNACTVGTNDLNVEENLFAIAPTLTSDISTITFNADFTGDKSIRVFNLMGEMVYTNQLATTTDAHQIDVTTYANGIYMVHVQVGNLISTKKIMKF
ncbi:MAG: hypothetical protein ACI9XO_001304 [Paraglaciecola sp.]|jgi:hypothetical protein